MNIRTDQVEALLRQQELAAKKAAPGTDAAFGATLAQQMELAAKGAGAKTTAQNTALPSGIVGQMLLTNAEKTSAPTDPVEQVMQQALDQASGALDMWESYVNALGKPGAENNLREAYALLQGLDTQVSSLKRGAEPVLGQNPNLASLVNELEIMTATEKFKFNRGDYN